MTKTSPSKPKAKKRIPKKIKPPSDVAVDRRREWRFDLPLPAIVEGKGGEGTGSCDVPRGILFHNYVINDEGLIQGANCVIPTNQNHANIQADMETLLPQLLDRPQEEITHMLEMLVRAYDPCISCSTHLLSVEFV